MNNPAIDPEDDPRSKEILDEVRSWIHDAEEGVPPTDAHRLLALVDERQTPTRSRLLPVGWVLATAALFLFALSQVQVRFEWGDAAITLGSMENINNQKNDQNSSQSNARFKSEHTEEFEFVARELAERTSRLEQLLAESTYELSQRQYVESMTRYNDIQTLLALTNAQLQEGR